MMKGMTVRLSEELFERIESSRGDSSRNAFVVACLEKAVGVSGTARPPGRPRSSSRQSPATPAKSATTAPSESMTMGEQRFFASDKEVYELAEILDDGFVKVRRVSDGDTSRTHSSLWKSLPMHSESGKLRLEEFS